MPGMAGYSGTPLPKKLGIKEGHTVGVVGPPPGFHELLMPLPDDVLFDDGPADVVIVFATTRSDLEERFNDAMARIPADGAIWIGWPKKSSPIESELSENDLREAILPTGLVDNKVCAIDDDWSGLRFVVRRELRDTWPAPTA